MAAVWCCAPMGRGHAPGGQVLGQDGGPFALLLVTNPLTAIVHPAATLRSHSIPRVLRREKETSPLPPLLLSHSIPAANAMSALRSLARPVSSALPRLASPAVASTPRGVLLPRTAVAAAATATAQQLTAAAHASTVAAPRVRGIKVRSSGQRGVVGGRGATGVLSCPSASP